MKNEDYLKLNNQLCFPIYVCAKEIVRKYTPILAPLSLTYTQYIVMLYMWEHGECNLKQLGLTLHLESNTLTPVVNKLIEKNYLKKSKSKTDERSISLSLTTEGKNLKERARLIPLKMAKCVSLTQEEAITLYSLIHKVIKNVEGE